MDINRAKEIVSALAEGVDPTTGEVLPNESVYNSPEVIRALYTLLGIANSKPSYNSLRNAGKLWSTAFSSLFYANCLFSLRCVGCCDIILSLSSQQHIHGLIVLSGGTYGRKKEVGC